MTSRERVLAVLNRQPIDRFPVDLWMTPEVTQSMCAHLGVDSEFAVYKALGVDKIAWLSPELMSGKAAGTGAADLAVGDGDAADGEVITSPWGVKMRRQQAGAAVYYETMAPPLAAYETPESLADYPHWPDPDGYDYDKFEENARRLHAEYATLGPWVSFFEIYCGLRGLENSLMDLMMNPDLVEAILDRVDSIQTGILDRVLSRAADHIDMVFISDDMGSQNNLLVSVDTWDQYFRDRLKRWCDLIHRHGVKVFYHSDGAVRDLLPRLVDAGIDVLNPIQHVCPGMDREGLKRDFGERVIFHGAVENQQTLPFGSADDVRQETLTNLRTLGAGGGGYIPCSCHYMQAGTPPENVIALVETVQGYTPGT